tara:strand:+ start:417 stop:716 length:300 start_codon:yes stop_codon:yes gene_type:complete
MFFSFYGRISRREYWWAQLSLLAFLVAVVIIIERTGGLDELEVSTAAVLSIVALLQIIWFFGICVACTISAGLVVLRYCCLYRCWASYSGSKLGSVRDR